MEQIYIERLLKFADYLDGIKNHPEHGLVRQVNFIALEDRVRIPYQAMYQHWVLDELPAVFDEWYYHLESGDALWENADPELGSIAHICLFFGLDQDSFCHCFDISPAGQLCERFGGTELDENSEGPDFARNIVEMVKAKTSN
jgi:hypothetical protein